MVMNSHGQNLLGGILSNNVLVEEFLDFGRLEDLEVCLGLRESSFNSFSRIPLQIVIQLSQI